MVTLPANGTRVWLTNDTSKGRDMGTPVTWTCPPDHAFQGFWSNDLIKYCRFNSTLSVALWDYWEAPPDNRSNVNITDWDIKHLPDCIRKLIISQAHWCIKPWFPKYSAYCFDAPDSPLNSTVTYNWTMQAIGDVSTMSCGLGFEYADQLADDSAANADPNDDFLIKQRRVQCQEPVHPEGGRWISLDGDIPYQCHSN